MRLKYSIYITCILIVGFNLESLNAQGFEWARSYGGVFNEDAVDICVDAAGNIYTTGSFAGMVDFDPGPDTTFVSSLGFFNTDIYVQKMDPSGRLIWAKSYGGFSDDRAYSIGLDSAGNIFVTGSFQDSIDIDPGAGINYLYSNGSDDILVQKMDSAGNVIWAKGFGSKGRDLGTSISIDAIGSVYTAGYFADTTDIDPGPGTADVILKGVVDVFIQKLDGSGNFVWARTFGGNGVEVPFLTKFDASGNLYTTGYFQDSVDFDPGSGTNFQSSLGGSDIFIQKLDTSGDFKWVRSFGGVSEDIGTSISFDDNGNLYITGSFEDSVDFDPGTGNSILASKGESDTFVQKMDSSGSFLWAKSFGGTLRDGGTAINIEATGGILTTGFFQDSVDFDPGTGNTSLNSLGRRGLFIQKIDPAGNFLWVRALRGAFDLNGLSTIDALNNIITIGSFKGLVDFDPGPAFNPLISNRDNRDAFILKMNPCNTESTIDTVVACESYTWIDGVTYSRSNNSASITLTSATGCDSIVNLDLTIESNSVSADVVNSCGPYTWINGITYNTSNFTTKDTLVNTAGCDSIVLLVLTIDSLSDITTTYTNGVITSNNENADYQWLNCDSSFAIISGETSRSFTPQVNGNYAVELIEKSCVDTSACVMVSSIGLVENGFGDQLKVFPNPTKGSFNIDLGDHSEDAEVTIRDITGKVIQSSTFNSGQLLNFSLDEPSGLYMIYITSAGKRAVIRMIKE